MLNLKLIVISIAFLPLIGAMIAGFGGRLIGPKGAHTVTLVAVGASFILSFYLFYIDYTQPINALNFNLYTFLDSGLINFHIGFLIDRLTLLMITVVTFVSWVVHLYTIGYMHKDPGYQRFFCYISLFTFGMLMLVMSNNFLQLFFGWEMVGLMSYLLIGFWFYKESAIKANLKAFIVNRVGDFGFIIGIAAVFYYFGTLDYGMVFKEVPHVAENPSIITFIGLALFLGAMGKSAQIPLHVWLPDSMEGPTPISALIHAATMVTAGVFMLARLSPLYEYSDIALNTILIIGTLTCCLMGLVGIVQSDIKRIIAYSTLSQLGYMMVAIGVSAYPLAIFHLGTHAFFKALLFLGAGSVILALHHEQDIWKMGALKGKMPITYITMLIGSLALIGFPGFSGFFSKDLIIEAVHYSNLPFAKIAYWAVLGSVLITALYTFRLFFVVFHTQARFSKEKALHIKESPKVIWVPLVLLAIPAIVSGIIGVDVLFNDFFQDAIVMHKEHTAFLSVKEEFLTQGKAWGMLLHGLTQYSTYLGLAGIFITAVFYGKKQTFPIAQMLKQRFHWLYRLLEAQYGFNWLNEKLLAPFVRRLGGFLWHRTDQTLIDQWGVNGSAGSFLFLSGILARLQTGYVYHYALIMIIGIALFVGFLIL